MKPKSTSRLVFPSRILAGSIAALLTAPGAFADIVNASVSLRIGNSIAGGTGNDTGALSLYNDGGGNVQRTFLQFGGLSSYSGNSITTDATMTLTAGVFGNFLTGVSLGTVNSAWTQGGATPISWANQPGLTAIPGATNPSGTFGSGPVTWTIPWYMLEKMATTGSGYNNGLGITSGTGSTQHFNAGTTPTLTFSAATGASSTLTGTTGNWTDTANWAGSTVTEGISQAATINGGTAVNITMNANRSVGALAFSGADHTISGGAGKLALNVTSGSPTVTVETARIATIGATVIGLDGLTKTGAGTLTLSGANTFTGATTLTDGVLSVATIGNGGVASGNLGSATSAAANLVFNGGTLQYTGATASTNRNFTINAGTTATFDITANNLTLTGTAPATNGGLTKTGAGTLSIDVAQIYTGSTTINGGRLTLTAGGLIAAASNIQVNSGTLTITDGGGGRTLANNMVLNGGIVMAAGTSVDNTGTGGTITFSMGNVIHTFTASGSLVLPTSVGSASQLIVGAGGGGGAGVFNNVYNAGGGGGQVLNLTGQTLAAGSTAVVVGTGGAGGNNASGQNGGVSSIGGNTAAGGFGATGANGTGGTSGSGIAGAGRNNGHWGGGGAGDSATGSGHNGGAGTLGAITGSFYGGGGGGGSDGATGVGGVGGGGNGSGGAPAAGTANTGGGGGGGGSSAAGGSGIVIVQYAYTPGGVVAGAVTLSGTIDLQSASTLNANGTGDLLNVSGLISTSAGAGGLTIASSNSAGGVVRFGSANTYAGNTTVNTGAILRMNATNALPSGSGKGNLSLSGTLDLNAQATTSLNGLSGAGTIDNNTGAGTYALSVGNNDQTSTFGGVIQNTTGTIGLTKTGTGTFTFAGTATHSGGTTVDAGTLLVGGSISGNVAVNNGGTLGGSGGTTGAVTVGALGTIAPGSSIGTLNTGAVSLGSGATFGLEINTTAATTDVLNISGNFSLAAAGGSVLTISDLSPAAFTSGAFEFINYSGTWDGDLFTYGGNIIADETTLFIVSGNTYMLDYNLGGDTVALIAVPEPGSAILLLGGLGVLAGVRRRRA